MLQVLLLPNFTMIVTAELRKYNGVDTVDLFEQAIFSQFLLIPVYMLNTNSRFLKLVEYRPVG
jgi:hypothetical protein